jgi:predicted helicase
MSEARISYFSLQNFQGKDAKLEWLERVSFEKIEFENINPDAKGNWINLTDNDFDSFLPLVDKEVKAGKSEKAIFKLFSRGVATQRDEWVYDFSKNILIISRVNSPPLGAHEKSKKELQYPAACGGAVYLKK